MRSPSITTVINWSSWFDLSFLFRRVMRVFECTNKTTRNLFSKFWSVSSKWWWDSNLQIIVIFKTHFVWESLTIVILKVATNGMSHWCFFKESVKLKLILRTVRVTLELKFRLSIIFIFAHSISFLSTVFKQNFSFYKERVWWILNLMDGIELRCEKRDKNWFGFVINLDWQVIACWIEGYAMLWMRFAQCEK